MSKGSPSMNIRLPQDLADFVDAKIEAGEASSRSDYIYRLIIMAYNFETLNNHIEESIKKSIHSMVECNEYRDMITSVIDRQIREKALSIGSPPSNYVETES